MENISVRMQNQILHCVLEGGSRGNSFGSRDARVLIEILMSNEAQACHGLLLSSRHPKFFCTGGNLREQSQLKVPQQHIDYHHTLREALRLLEEFPKPTVALVEGDCFGGGMEVISCFDCVIATPGALFGFWQRRIGLSFGWGGRSRWLKRLPEHKLKRLVLEARCYSSYEALELGLVDHVVPRGDGQRAAFRWIYQTQKWPSITLEGVKNFEREAEVEAFENLLGNSFHLSALNKHGRK